jgi:hypothetical protein
MSRPLKRLSWSLSALDNDANQPVVADPAPIEKSSTSGTPSVDSTERFMEALSISLEICLCSPYPHSLHKPASVVLSDPSYSTSQANVRLLVLAARSEGQL